MKAIIITILLTACQTMYAQIPSNGLVAYFPFFGNAKDSSVNKTHGTVYNATLSSDRYGNAHGAYQFSGNSNSYIQFPATNLQNNRYTYSLWAKINEVPFEGEMAFALNIGSTGGDQSLNIANNYAGTYNGWLGGGYNTTAPHFGMQQNSNLNTSSWSHVVCVRDSTYTLLFINGVLVDSMGSSVVKTPSYGSGTVQAFIGIRNNGDGAFNGKIDDVCIYNRALSKSEVLALYNDNSTTSITNVAANNFNIYPNPGKNNFRIEMKNLDGDITKYSFKLFNTIGQQVNFTLIQNSDNTMDIRHQLATGVYTLVMSNTTNGLNSSTKIIIE